MMPKAEQGAEQLPMPLDHRPALGRAAFLVSPANEAAVRAIADWPAWPGRRLALVGPARAGKSHLAHVWMHESGARRIEARALVDASVPALAAAGRLVVEDIETVAGLSPLDRRRAEAALLHLLNLAAAEKGWILLTGREAPARWPVEMPDLASRLAALPVARIGPPDDALLCGLMVKLFADRQLRVSPETVRYLVTRLERSFASIERAVAMLDARSLATRRRVTRALAAECLAALMPREPEPGDG